MRVPPARVLFPEEDRAEILAQIDTALASGQLTLGPLGRNLEEAFAARHRSAHAIAVSSGTSALEIILRAVGVENREVLVPANTFFATAAAAAHAGARVRFVECDPRTMAFDLADVSNQIGPDTAAVVAVHIGGLISPDLPALATLCAERGIALVEDAAHAHGSALNEQPAGTFGIAGAFSFYPTKVIAGGEGGMIVTNDARIDEEARTYRDQGKGSFLANFHTRLGANWRMSEPHAAIVHSQLRRLDEFIAARQNLAKRYDAALDSMGLQPLVIPAAAHCNYYKYIAFLPDGVDRAALKQLMRERFDVGLSGEVYDTPLHKQPVFEQFADRALPGAESLCGRHICLPLYPSLAESDADYVVESLGTALAELGAPRVATGVDLQDKLIAVTGGSGFVGSHVVDALLGAGYEVRVIDPKQPMQSEVDWADVDMLDQDSVTDAVKGADAVFHLAAMADVNDIVADPAGSVALNTLGVARVLEAGRRADTGRVIVSSTVWVYAATQGDVVDETTLFDLETDRHLYVSEKIAAEMFCRDYATLFGRPYTCLRYGIPFGPRMRSDLVVAAFLLRAMRGEPLRIDGDGSQERRFVYVEDLAAADVLVLKPVANNRTYNLESEEAISIRQLAETVRDVVGDVEVTFGPTRPGDYRARIVQSERARRELGWTPTHTFAEGLAKTLAWYREQLADS